jgi:hypothetical protein
MEQRDICSDNRLGWNSHGRNCWSEEIVAEQLKRGFKLLHFLFLSLIYAPLGICENLEGGINFSMKNQPKIVILNRIERARRIVKTDTQKIRLKILKTLEEIYNKPGYHTPKIQKHRTRRKTRA